MWARRCGLPSRWPSRLKVVLFGFLNGAIGLSIYEYMAKFNVGYLDLKSPEPDRVTCLKYWPSRDATTAWVNVNDWVSWAEYTQVGWIEENSCPIPSGMNSSCKHVKISMSRVNLPPSKAMSDAFSGFDSLGTWAHLFLFVCFIVWLPMTIHDLALIGPINKDFVLDCSGYKKFAPCMYALFTGCIGCCGLPGAAKGAKGGKQKAIAFAALVMAIPFLIVWNCVFLLLILLPLFSLTLCVYPIRMSRVWIFASGIIGFLVGIGMTVHQGILVVRADLRPRYGVTWPADPQSKDCTCGCNYPIDFSVCTSLLVAGVTVTVKSLLVIMRTLKGLRRAQWANLMSVLFTIPLTVYAVEWRQPDGKPIQNRTDEMPDVQAEVAFDPFALMDEQPDSANNTCHLRPTPAYEAVATRSGDASFRRLEGPQIIRDAERVEITDHVKIGCCGFPWSTGGQQGVYTDAFMQAMKVPEPSASAVAAATCVRVREQAASAAAAATQEAAATAAPALRAGASGTRNQNQTIITV